MLNKNSRAIKVLTLCLIFTLVFSFNMVYADTNYKVFVDNPKNVTNVVVYFNDDRAPQELTKSGNHFVGPDGGEYLSSTVSHVVLRNNGVTQTYLRDQLIIGTEGEGSGSFKIEITLVAPSGEIQVNKTYQDDPNATAAPQSGVVFTLSGNGLEESLTATTDAGGIVSFTDLAPGTYTLTETVPEGYTSSLGNPATKSIVVAAGATITENVLNTKGTTPPPTPGSIQVNKTYRDDPNATAAPQSGVVFTLSGNGLEASLTGTTNEEGIVSFTDLAPGTYTLTESVPAEYTSSLGNPATKSIVVAAGATITENVLNTKGTTPPPSKGSIQINKTYSPALVEEETAPVAIFGLYIKEEGEYLPSRSNLTITGEDSAPFSDLSFGTYYLKEKAPEGYTLSITDMTANDDGYYEIVVDSTTAIVLAAVNTEGSTPPPTTGKIIINKTYQYNDNGETPVYRVMDVPVAYFDLYELFGDYAVVTQGIAGEGTLEFDNLAPGEYCLHERAPEGFNPYFNGTAVGNNGCYGITIQAGGEITVNVVNAGYGQEPVFGSVEITKLNQRGLPWDGKSVKFTLYIKSGETDKYVEYLSGNTDVSAENKGKLVFEGLDISKTYYLSEQVPQGYRSSLGAYTLVVFNEDHIALFEVTNRKVSSGGGSGPGSDPEEPITPTPEEPVLTPPEEPVVIPEEPEVFTPPAGELPKTGGNTAGYLLSGSTLAALGILLRRFQR